MPEAQEGRGAKRKLRRALRHELRSLSTFRRRHSYRVKRLALQLHQRFQRQHLLPARIDVEIAALAHDLCKELPLEKQFALAELWAKQGKEERGREFEDFAVHGPAAAAYLLREKYFTAEAILEAVALHSMGAEGLGPIGQLIYLADKLEPQRSNKRLDLDKFRKINKGEALATYYKRVRSGFADYYHGKKGYED